MVLGAVRALWHVNEGVGIGPKELAHLVEQLGGGRVAKHEHRRILQPRHQLVVYLNAWALLEPGLGVAAGRKGYNGVST